jgi:hypothetical protein
MLNGTNDPATRLYSANLQLVDQLRYKARPVGRFTLASTSGRVPDAPGRTYYLRAFRFA